MFIYSSLPLSAGNILQDPQYMPKTVDSRGLFIQGGEK